MMLNVHPMIADAVLDPTKPLIFVEGTKQYLAAVTALVGGGDYTAVGLSGCNGWLQGGDPVDDFGHLNLGGRDVITCFDADWTTNRDVYDAAKRLTDWLTLHGARTVKHISLPGGGNTGLDDVLSKFEDTPAKMRLLIEGASEKLGRRPAKRNEHLYFDDDGSLLTRTAATALLDTFPCALAEDGSVAVYRNGRYIIDPHHHALYGALGDLLGEKYRPTHRASIEEFVKGILAAEGKRLGSAKHGRLLNLANGMLDLDSFELLPHDPKYLSAVQLPVRWIPDAQCPTYEAWIGAVLADGQLADLEEVIGTMLDSSTTPTKSLFAFGPSRSGKSTILRLMTDIMGGDNTSAVTLHQLSDDRFAAAELYGKKLNVAADLSSRHVEDISTWKMLTGEDRVTANRKYGAQFTFLNQALFAFSANELPTVGESSRAYFERVKPFSFPNSFAGREDPSIEHTMRNDELPGILRRWVEAHHRRVARGSFRATSQAVLGQFEAASDRVRLWLNEEMEIISSIELPDGTVRATSAGSELPATKATTKTDLHDVFAEWAALNGFSGLGMRKFVARLTSVNGVYDDIRIMPKRARGINIVRRPEDVKIDNPSSSGRFGQRQDTLPMGSDRSTEGGKGPGTQNHLYVKGGAKLPESPGQPADPFDEADTESDDEAPVQIGVPRTVLHTGDLSWTTAGVGPVYDLFGGLLPACEVLPCGTCGQDRQLLPPSHYIRICAACQPAMFQEAS
jgi:putative DNA primase/helicase